MYKDNPVCNSYSLVQAMETKRESDRAKTKENGSLLRNNVICGHDIRHAERGVGRGGDKVVEVKYNGSESEEKNIGEGEERSGLKYSESN